VSFDRHPAATTGDTIFSWRARRPSLTLEKKKWWEMRSCEEERSNLQARDKYFFFLSLSSYTCLEENQSKDDLIPILGQRRATRRYMRRSTSMTLQTGVKEWLDGGKKRHAQALVWCTSVTQIRYGWVGSQLSSQMLILVATLLLCSIYRTSVFAM
jgi:hypothetical protein